MVDTFLAVWFVVTAICAAYVAWDLYTRTPAMKVMKPGWVLVTLYTGIFGLLIYLLTCRAPEPGLDAHDEYIKPLWRQAAGSMVHCLAGDATGVIATSIIVYRLGLPSGIDVTLEYLSGFVVGLFVFQAVFMAPMLGGYWLAVRKTFMAEWLSMNMVMAGMIPVMVILMQNLAGAENPTGMRYWGVMSVATLAGAVLAYPMNYWLVGAGVKHGMMTERPMAPHAAHGKPEHAEHAQAGHGEHASTQAGHDMADAEPSATGEHASHARGASAGAMTLCTVISLAFLAAGFIVATIWGDLTV